MIGENKNTTIIDGNNQNDVVLITSDYITIAGFTIQNSGNEHAGISLLDSSYNTITECTIRQNSDGVRLEGSSMSNTIVGNNIIENYYTGVNLTEGSSDNEIVNNTIQGNTKGIKEYKSKYNIISQNKILENSIEGIHITTSSDNTIISDNIFEDNTEYNIRIWGCSNNTISDNFINQTQDNQATGIQIRHSSSINNSIIRNTFTDNGYFGVDLRFSTDNNVLDNHISGSVFSGIYLMGSCDNTISNNTLTEDWTAGLYMEYSSCDNLISDNLIEDNLMQGIQIKGSSNNNTIAGNIVSNHSQIGILIDGSDDNKIISGNTITRHHYGSGVVLSSSSNCTIDGNTFTDNYYGIFISRGNYNVISSNTVVDSLEIGVCIDDYSHSNTIHHNDFVGNLQNAYDTYHNQWDDGSQGNYWDDYNGFDGDGDGIGDTPYDIPGGTNQDRYPLGYFNEDTVPPTVEITKPEIALYLWNVKIISLEWLSSPIPILIGNIDIEVNAMADESGVERVEFYIDDELKYSDYSSPYLWNWNTITLLRFTHTIRVTCYDGVGNSNTHEMNVVKFL